MSFMEILRINDLKTHFNTPYGVVKAVDGVSFNLKRGETLGMVGESGVGKSVTAFTVMGLAWRLGAMLVSGEVWYSGENLLAKPELYRQVRGKKISLIPQEAGAALNPVLTVGDQLGEMLKVHRRLSGEQIKSQTALMLEEVQLPEPDLTARLYPYQLSGGMLQRVLLAMALCCSPDIIIADEPASSLDTTIQAQILALLREVKACQNLSMILIAHDLGIISRNCDQVVVMYAGRVLETGPVAEILAGPRHPYTVTLLEIYRCMDKGNGGCGYIKGSPPSPYESAAGCVFAHRCRNVSALCECKRPELQEDGGHMVACHYV